MTKPATKMGTRWKPVRVRRTRNKNEPTVEGLPWWKDEDGPTVEVEPATMATELRRRFRLLGARDGTFVRSKHAHNRCLAPPIAGIRLQEPKASSHNPKSDGPFLLSWLFLLPFLVSGYHGEGTTFEPEGTTMELEPYTRYNAAQKSWLQCATEVLHSISAQCASKRLYVRCLLAYLVMMPGQILFYLYDLYMGTDPAARWFALFEKEKILRDSFAEYLRSTPNVTISSWICGRAPGCDQFLDQLWEKLSK